MTEEVYIIKDDVYHIKAQLEAISFINSVEFVGSIELRGWSNHDTDFLASFKLPVDWDDIDDGKRFDWLIERFDEIISILGEKEGTHRSYIIITTGEMPWCGYVSKTVGSEVPTHCAFTTPDGFSIDVHWVGNISAFDALNHDYWADKVLWRIDEKGEE